MLFQYRHWREKEGTCWFQFAACPYQSHFIGAASPWLQQWFPIASTVLLFPDHPSHPPSHPHATSAPRELLGRGSPPALQELSSEQIRCQHQQMVPSPWKVSAMALWDPYFQLLKSLVVRRSEWFSTRLLLVCCRSGWHSLSHVWFSDLCGFYSWPLGSENSNVFPHLWRQYPFSHLWLLLTSWCPILFNFSNICLMNFLYWILSVEVARVASFFLTELSLMHHTHPPSVFISLLIALGKYKVKFGDSFEWIGISIVSPSNASSPPQLNLIIYLFYQICHSFHIQRLWSVHCTSYSISQRLIPTIQVSSHCIIMISSSIYLPNFPVSSYLLIDVSCKAFMALCCQTSLMVFLLELCLLFTAENCVYWITIVFVCEYPCSNLE